MSKFDGFGPVYVINLERRLDRRKYIERHFAEHGVSDFHFFTGFDGSHLDGLYKMSGGSIGNTMSHLLLMQSWLLSDNSDYLFVCEDDISLENSKYWTWTWKDLWNKLDFHFDILHLSTCSFDFHIPDDLSIQRRSKEATGLLTSCYVVSRDGANKILQKTTNDAGEIVFDFNDLDNIPDHGILYKNVEKYYLFPLFTQDTEFGSEADPTCEFDRFHRMNKDHTEWLWKYNNKEIENIPVYH